MIQNGRKQAVTGNGKQSFGICDFPNHLKGWGRLTESLQSGKGSATWPTLPLTDLYALALFLFTLLAID